MGKINKCLSFLLFILLLSPCYSQLHAGSLSDQIENEVLELENLKKSYQEVETKLETAEQNLENAEKSLNQMNQDLMELSKDYEKSQKKLKFWKTFAIAGVSVSLAGGVITGLCIGLCNR